MNIQVGEPLAKGAFCPAPLIIPNPQRPTAFFNKTPDFFQALKSHKFNNLVCTIIHNVIKL
jgi:hypothetical protein